MVTLFTIGEGYCIVAHYYPSHLNPVSKRHVELQPSYSILFPSSHSSLLAFKESPHVE